MWHVPIHVIIMNRLYNKMSLLYQKIYIHLIIKYYSEGWWWSGLQSGPDRPDPLHWSGRLVQVVVTWPGADRHSMLRCRQTLHACMEKWEGGGGQDLPHSSGRVVRWLGPDVPPQWSRRMVQVVVTWPGAGIERYMWW